MRLATTPSSAPPASASHARASSRSRRPGDSCRCFGFHGRLKNAFQRGAALGQRRIDQALAHRRRSGCRTGSGSPASRPPACGPGSRPDGAASAARRRTARRRRDGQLAVEHELLRLERASIADHVGEIAGERLAGLWPLDRPHPRRGRRGSESHPIWARTASRARSAALRQASPPSARWSSGTARLLA